MAISYSPAIRNDRMNAITTNAGSGAKIQIYTQDYDVLLAECVCSTPLAPDAVLGKLTFNLVNQSVAINTGIAEIAKIVTSTGSKVVDNLTVSEIPDTANITISNSTILSGNIVYVNLVEMIEGNP